MDIADLTTLQQHVSGDIILPGDAAYEEASKVFMKKGTPVVIVRPKSAQDVAAAISYARQNELVISVRSGGHSGPGLSTNDGGMMIDLVTMHTIDVDTEQRLVHVDGGATWGLVADTLKEQGLAISSGDTRSVGVGGLTLHGGMGWMIRKYGLALDQLKEVEIVTAHGDILTANEHENTDLFWGVRGAGSNFGVVTRFTFEAHPLRSIYSGSISYEPGNLEALLTGWRNIMRDAPEELNTTFLVMPAMWDVPAGVQILCCYGGDEEAGKKAVAPLLELPDMTKQDLKTKDYADILEEAHAPEGMEILVYNTLTNDFSDEFIKSLVAHTEQLPGGVLMMRYIGNGAFNRVPADATAFVHRNAELMTVSAGFVPPGAPADTKPNIRKAWGLLEPFSAGSYGNFLNDATQKEVAAIYPPKTLQRLRQLKTQYDPENVFNQNFNILPE